jgi:hypothetical protein
MAVVIDDTTGSGGNQRALQVAGASAEIENRGEL